MKKLIDIIFVYFFLDCVLHPIKNASAWLILFAVFGLLAIMVWAIPVLTGMSNAAHGFSSATIPVVSYQPGGSAIYVMNNTGKTLTNIQFDVPLYQCPDNMPGAFYHKDVIAKSSCYPARVLGMKRTISYMTEDNAGNYPPGKIARVLEPRISYELDFDGAVNSMRTQGYHIVASDPVFYSATAE